MADRVSKKTRSRIMSKIKSKNTSLELNFQKQLWNGGLGGFRLHYCLLGKPDIVFVKQKVVIFLDGDFWHGYNWKKLGRVPPKGYWQEKIQRNINRAKVCNRQLRKNGWKVLRFWEHNIKKNPEKYIKIIKKELLHARHAAHSTHARRHLRTP